LIGLAGVPTIIAIGPFENRSETEELAQAFATVRRRCVVQLAVFGNGRHRTTVVRRAFAHGVGSDVHLLRNYPAGWWPDIIAAADIVVPSIASGPTRLLDVLSAGRPVVAPIDSTTLRLVVPTSAVFVYRRGDASAMTAALLRLLTMLTLRHEMSCRAAKVARTHPLPIRLQQPAGGSENA
jgi:glycosyltransferase involved in cell wall biosynthesis